MMKFTAILITGLLFSCQSPQVKIETVATVKKDSAMDRAIALYNEGNWDKSLELFSSFEKNETSYNWIAKIYVKKEMFTDAIQLARKSLTLKNDQADPFFIISSCYLHMKDWEKAFLTLERAITKYPQDNILLYNLAWYYLEQKKFAKSHQVLSKILNANKGWIFARLLLARLYLLEENYTDGLKLLTELKLTDPSNPAILTNLGICFAALNQKENAENSFNEAIRFNPDYPVAHYNLALLYNSDTDVAQLQKSIGHFEKYKKLMGTKLDPQDIVFAQIKTTYDKINTATATTPETKSPASVDRK